MQSRKIDTSARQPAASFDAGQTDAGATPGARQGIGRWLASLVVALTAAAFAPEPAQAGTVVPPTVYCVGNVTQLRNAQLAIESTGGAFDLRIRSGYYALTAQSGGVDNYGLRLRKVFGALEGQTGASRISGTWNVGCTQRAELIDGTNSTTLDAQDQVGNLIVVSDSLLFGDPPQPIHDLTIERIQFANGVPSGGQACVFVTTSGTRFFRLNMTIDRIRVELCEGTGLASVAQGAATVRNSVFLGNSAQFYPAVNIGADEGTASLYNSTFRFNRMGSQLSAHVRLRGPTVYAFNNLFADADYGGGPARDIIVAEGTGIARNNRLAGIVLHATGGGLIQSGNTAVTPGFANAFGPQLAASSPLRDLGLSAVPLPGFGDRDFFGKVRVRGPAVDIGADELAPLDAMFSNGFEAP